MRSRYSQSSRRSIESHPCEGRTTVTRRPEKAARCAAVSHQQDWEAAACCWSAGFSGRAAIVSIYTLVVDPTGDATRSRTARHRRFDEGNRRSVPAQGEVHDPLEDVQKWPRLVWQPLRCLGGCVL